MGRVGHPNHSFFSFHVSFFDLKVESNPLKMELQAILEWGICFFAILKGPVNSHT